MSMFKKMYTRPAKCHNCGHRFNIRIPKGMKATEFLESGKALCINCECDDISIDVPEGEIRK